MFKQAGEVVNLSFNISDDEKNQASDCNVLFEKVSERLSDLNDYIDKIYIPFKTHDKVSEKSVNRYKGALKRYADSIDEKFVYIKKLSILAISKLEIFSSDMKIQDILNAFSDAMSVADENITSLSKTIEAWDLATDIEKEDGISYRKSILQSCENTKKQISESINLIEDRITSYINDNILSNSWVQNVSNELEIEEELGD